MPITVRNNGKNNIVRISESDIQNGNALIEIHGDNNFISIDTAHGWGGPHIIVQSDARVSIGPECVLSSLLVFAAPGAEVEIGARTGFSGATSLMAHEPAKISIGEECLFGSETHVLASDMHSIIDCSSGQRINPPRDIIISQKVWIGFRSIVLKGAQIGEGSIIGASSTVCGSIPAYCSAAGAPARVLREGVTWDKALLPVG
ncbi:acyltransferase [Azospirillum argentinense]